MRGLLCDWSPRNSGCPFRGTLSPLVLFEAFGFWEVRGALSAPALGLGCFVLGRVLTHTVFFPDQFVGTKSPQNCKAAGVGGDREPSLALFTDYSVLA